MTTEQLPFEIQRELESVLIAAQRISKDLGNDVEQILAEGRARPLTKVEARRLLDRIVEVLRERATGRGDRDAIDSLCQGVEVVIDRLVARAPTQTESIAARPSVKVFPLQSYNGDVPGPVSPRPTFHGRSVPMNCGWVKTADIPLWDQNERLEIHLGQFQMEHGRRASGQELIDLMLGKMPLPGVTTDDQFEIVELARSIAVNGVRKPPILARDGTLLDGNRRITACRYILSSEDYSPEQKQRVDHVFVWQLTEHATPDEQEAVVVSLNFEADCKQDWPQYIKAKKVHEAWQAMMAVEARTPTNKRIGELKRNLSKKFALGPDTTTVSRYLRMMGCALDFEAYHIQVRRRDRFEVQHKSNRYFQYFDELTKGEQPGGVWHTLNRNESFKHLVYELLYQGKFTSWQQIRQLKHIQDNIEAVEYFNKALHEKDEEQAQEAVENAIDVARTRRADNRQIGADTRIDTFTTWLLDLPVGAFRSIRPENLKRLGAALELVNAQAVWILNQQSLFSDKAKPDV